MCPPYVLLTSFEELEVANYQYGMETIGDFAHSIETNMFIKIVVDMFFPTKKKLNQFVICWICLVQAHWHHIRQCYALPYLFLNTLGLPFHLIDITCKANIFNPIGWNFAFKSTVSDFGLAFGIFEIVHTQQD